MKLKIKQRTLSNKNVRYNSDIRKQKKKNFKIRSKTMRADSRVNGFYCICLNLKKTFYSK